MKKYTKDGVIKYQNEIIINDGEFQTINPSINKLLEHGWKEYIDTDVEKNNMLQNILNYDKSETINVFYIDDIPFWYSKEERNYLINRINAEIVNNQTSTTIWYNHQEYLFDVNFMIDILNKVELYAAKCFDITQRHYNYVSSLTSVEEIESFDYMTDYPEILKFYTA